MACMSLNMNHFWLISLCAHFRLFRGPEGGGQLLGAAEEPGWARGPSPNRSFLVCGESDNGRGRSEQGPVRGLLLTPRQPRT